MLVKCRSISFSFNRVVDFFSSFKIRTCLALHLGQLRWIILPPQMYNCAVLFVHFQIKDRRMLWSYDTVCSLMLENFILVWKNCYVSHCQHFKKAYNRSYLKIGPLSGWSIAPPAGWPEPGCLGWRLWVCPPQTWRLKILVRSEKGGRPDPRRWAVGWDRALDFCSGVEEENRNNTGRSETMMLMMALQIKTNLEW